MRFGKPHLFASALLVSWACAKGNTVDPGADDPYTPPTSGRGGTTSRSGSGGSITQSGSGGTTAANGGTVSESGGTSATGGTSAETGGSSTGGRGSGGEHSSGAMGGTSPVAGHNGTGGTGGSSTAGRAATGGMDASGGVATNGGTGNGGRAAGGATSGGTGAAGLPNDPNWKPPDMTASAKIVVLYQPNQTAPSATNIQFTLELKNQTDAAYDLSKVTIRYWMSAEPPPKSPTLYYQSSGLNVSSTPAFVPNMANSYVLFTFGKGGSVPPYVDQNTLNSTKIQYGVQSGINNTNFNQANDWSFDATATAAKPNPKITLYDGDTLIWGCEPSHVCAEPPSTGEAGAGGQAAL